MIRSRGDNEVIVLAGHIHSHGGSWKKCVETPFPVQLCGEAEVSDFTSSLLKHSQTMKGVGGGADLCSASRFLVAQVTDGRDLAVSVVMCHPLEASKQMCT